MLDTLQHDLVVWIEHSELHLNIVCIVWVPLSFSHLLDINVEFDVIFNLVVLGIGSTVFQILLFAGLTFFIVAKMSCLKYS